MNKTELKYVDKIDKICHKLINALCDEFPEKLVHSMTKTHMRVFTIIDEIQLCTHMLRSGIETKKNLKKIMRLVNKHKKLKKVKKMV